VAAADHRDESGAVDGNGSYEFAYDREFFDYRKAEVSARIRSIGGERR